MITCVGARVTLSNTGGKSAGWTKMESSDDGGGAGGGSRRRRRSSSSNNNCSTQCRS